MTEEPEFILELYEESETHVGINRHGDPEHTEHYPDRDYGLSRKLRAEIGELAASEEAHFTAREWRKDSSQGKVSKHYFGGGYDVARTLTEIAPFASAAGLGAFLTKAGQLLLKWRQLQDRRMIKIKTKDFAIVVNNEADFDKAVKALAKLQKHTAPKSGAEAVATEKTPKAKRKK
jgi:hypothetical protein